MKYWRSRNNSAHAANTKLESLRKKFRCRHNYVKRLLFNFQLSKWNCSIPNGLEKACVVEDFREKLNVQQSGFKWYYLAALNLSLALKQFKRTCRRFLSKNFKENQVNHTSSFHLSPQKQRNLNTHISSSWLRSFVHYESIFPPQKCVACKCYRIIILSWDLHTLWSGLCVCCRAFHVSGIY